MSPTFIIDRIENQIAIIELGDQTFEIPIAILPDGIQEGDHCQIQRILPAKNSDAEERLARLKERDPGSDIIDL